jgi:hypothetical protein
MRTKLTVAAAAVAALLATSLVSGSAQATSLPVLKSNANQSDVTLVGRRGGGGGGGGRGFKGSGGGGGGFKAYGSGGGFKAYRGGGGGRYAYRSGSNPWYNYKGGKNYAYKNYGNHNRYKNYGNYNRYKNYGHYNNYRRFYGWPYIAYGAGYGYGGCNWLYRNAVATGSAYWWNRYYNCTGYY